MKDQAKTVLDVMGEARELQARHAPRVLGAAARWILARAARPVPAARGLGGREVAAH